MPLPQLKVNAYASEVLTTWYRPSDARLTQIASELRALLRTASPHDAGSLYVVIGTAELRLGARGDAVRSYEKAVRLRRDMMSLSHLANAYLITDRAEEALALWVEASELEKNRSVLLLANLAEAFAVLGREDDAWDMLRDAIRFADSANVEHLFLLATQSAELGADELAVEFFAQFLAVLTGKPRGQTPLPDFIKSQRPANLDLSMHNALDAALRRTIAFGGALEPLRRTRVPRVTEVDEDALASALDVFESLRSARGRATEASIAAGSSDGTPATTI